MAEISHTKRHWLYGFNAVVLVAIAVAILVLVSYLTQKWRTSFDWTSGGLYSLSGSTKSLLKEAEAKQQSYELLSMYRPGERSQRVMDLLNEYARQSKAIKATDVSDVSLEETERRIRSLYTEEIKPYETTIGGFEPLAEELTKFFKQEGANVGALAQKPGASEALKRAAAETQGAFTKVLPEKLAYIANMLRKLTESTSPEWSSAASLLKTGVATNEVPSIDMLETTLKIYVDPAKRKDALPEELLPYFASAEGRFKDILAKVTAYREQLDKLQPLKVQEVLDAIGERSVVVIGPQAVKVISHEELFKRQPGSDTEEEFNGEQAVSSAILSLARPEKVKVVFVTVTPQRLTGPGGPFSDMISTLEQSNFEVMEWSPPSATPNPQAPPPSPTPPAQGAGVVWVVFPPDPPNPQMMMMGMPPPDPQPVIGATRQHMAAGGQVLFLSEASSGMMGMMGLSGYPYADLVKDFGVEVQSQYTVVQRFQREGQDGELVAFVIPAVLVQRYPETEITRPMQGLQTLFRYVSGQMGPMGMPTVVGPAKTLPEGANVKVLVETPKSPDVWGESNFSEKMEKSTFDKGQDLASPLPMAVSATRGGVAGGGGKESRIVVIGSKFFAMNPTQDEVQLVWTGREVQRILRYPGNQELFRNSVLWLAGYENMIAVSAKANAALRIGDISPGTLTAIRWGVLFLGVPFATLVIGGIVWFIRRK
ncbi:MAG: GldG family protein [Phycisphaerales bacterium]|nr:GldG family protein [Phycisphaerales bacterium]